MKHLYSILLIVLGFSSLAFGQRSVVGLSSLKVTEIMDPSAGALNNFLIEITVSDPLQLTKLEVVLEDKSDMAKTTTLYLPVIIKENIAELMLEKYAIPFVGQNLVFNLMVRDQFTAPYHRILIKAYDRGNQETNQLIFTRPN